MPNPPPTHWIQLYRAVLALGCGLEPYVPCSEFDAAQLYGSLRNISPGLLQKRGEWRALQEELGLEIFFDNAKFQMAIADPEFSVEVFEPTRRLSARPWDFSTELELIELLGVKPDVRHEILVLSEEILERAAARFDQMLWDDEWKLMARLGSPLARDFERIPFDVWQHLTVEDWELGVAVSPTGERVYSLYAAPSDSLGKIDLEAIGLASTRQRRTLPRRQSAIEAIAELWPGGVPGISEEPNKHLVAEVEDWCRRNHRVKPGADTILRAAGRR